MSLGYELKVEQWVPRPRGEVFAFFSDAHNLERITPPWLNFKILRQSTPKIERGTHFDYKLRVRGFPVKWTTEITEWHEGRSFVDNQKSGPYRLWNHLHTFEDRDGGTFMVDRVKFILPFGFLGKSLMGWLVKSDVKEIFSYRAMIISKDFGGKGAESIVIEPGAF